MKVLPLAADTHCPDALPFQRSWFSWAGTVSHMLVFSCCANIFHLPRLQCRLSCLTIGQGSVGTDACSASFAAQATTCTAVAKSIRFFSWLPAWACRQPLRRATWDAANLNDVSGVPFGFLSIQPQKATLKQIHKSML